jgi:hypothetical protein
VRDSIRTAAFRYEYFAIARRGDVPNQILGARKRSGIPVLKRIAGIAQRHDRVARVNDILSNRQLFTTFGDGMLLETALPIGARAVLSV